MEVWIVQERGFIVIGAYATKELAIEDLSRNVQLEFEQSSIDPKTICAWRGHKIVYEIFPVKVVQE